MPIETTQSMLTVFLTLSATVCTVLLTWALKRFLDTIPKTQDVANLKATLDRLCESIDDVSETITRDLENVRIELKTIQTHMHIHDKKISILESKEPSNTA